MAKFQDVLSICTNWSSRIKDTSITTGYRDHINHVKTEEKYKDEHMMRMVKAMNNLETASEPDKTIILTLKKANAALSKTNINISKALYKLETLL